MYGSHKTPHVLEMLEKYRIGNWDPPPAAAIGAEASARLCAAVLAADSRLIHWIRCERSLCKRSTAIAGADRAGRETVQRRNSERAPLVRRCASQFGLDRVLFRSCSEYLTPNDAFYVRN